jgi:hypothetical protein
VATDDDTSRDDERDDQEERDTSRDDERDEDSRDDTGDEDGRDDGDGRDDEDSDDADRQSKDDDVAEMKRELGRLKRQLRRANKESERLRQAGASTDPKLKEEKEQAEQQTAGLRGEVDNWRKRTLRAEARSAFAASGTLSKAQVNRLVKMVDLADVEIDDSGEVTGLDDQIDEIKADFPDLFNPQRRRSPDLDVKDRKPRDTDRRGGLSQASRRMLGR